MDHLITQIYEIQTPAEARTMVDCGIDHIGSVVLSDNDWKQRGLYEAVRTVKASGRKSSLILLFHDPEAVVAALAYYQPDIVHFCEDLSFCGGGDAAAKEALWPLIELQTQIRQRFPEIRIMRSIPIQQAGAVQTLPVLELARLFAPSSDYFLTDTWMAGGATQPVSGYVGITGKTCCWETAAELVAVSPIPVILAGGLSPENVFEAILAVRPAGVDSCTLTNALDASGRPLRFKKDPGRVRRFVSEARRAGREILHPAPNPDY